MGRAGFEHGALKASKTPISENPRTESGTVDDKTQQNDRDLALLKEAWPGLPQRIKHQVNELIRSYVEGTTD